MRMHVPVKHHRRVVGSLVAVIIVLLGLVGVLAKKTTPISPPEPATTYLQNEEVVIIAPQDGGKEPSVPTVLPVEKVLFEYIEVTDGCDPNFNGGCLNVRSGPGEDFSVVARLRTGMVLKVGGKVERDGRAWYKIVFDEWLRYPQRVSADWYVSADYVEILFDEGDRNLVGKATSTQKIIIDRSEQKLYAYYGDELFMETLISTGIELTPTPRGAFTIFKKTPSRYMQGPIPGISEKEYDLPGVPWDIYFTKEGAAIHGTYWHENFGTRASNGCVNLPLEAARKLYEWAELGARVIVRD